MTKTEHFTRLVGNSKRLLKFALMSFLEYLCQHPRWNLTAQGSPISVYMKYDVVKCLTLYIINSKSADTVTRALKKILHLSIESFTTGNVKQLPLSDPFEVHVLLSSLSCETSKFHIKRLRRFMWTQLNAVDDELVSLKSANRVKLRSLTRELQVISLNIDSMIANANVAILCAAKMLIGQQRLSATSRLSTIVHRGQAQRIRDGTEHIMASMEKQKMWLLNYKQRKDTSMTLIFNLVTQQDAIQNMEIAAEMRKDSSSMNGIALLTMIFLPGTFTSVRFLVEKA